MKNVMDSEVVDRRRNCFTFIRLLAAFEVFIGHASEHFEIPLPPFLYEIWYAFRGVPIFFILSGFLIWNSLQKEQSFKMYCTKRVARLYPELWCGVLLNAVIMLFVYHEAISPIPFLLFTITQATVLQFWTPNSLRGYGVGTPNGSLWTIGVMVQSYLALWLLQKWVHKKKRTVAFFFGLLCFGILLNIGTPFLKAILPSLLYKLWLQTFFPYIWLFSVGVIICEYFESIIRILKKYWLLIFVISLLISILHLEDGIGIYGTVKSVLLGLAIIGFGYAAPQITIKHDYSYGFYIYHMVIINLLVEYGYVGKISYVLVALITTAVLTVTTYYVIESVKRKLKERIA